MRSNTPENPSAIPAQGFSRRQVTTAAAWSLPLIAVAVAAPAASASTSLFSSSFGLGGTIEGGIYLSSTLTNSTLSLTDTGSTPASTGAITIILRLPNVPATPYVAYFGPGATNPLSTSGVGVVPGTDWTYTYSPTAGGRPRFYFYHPGISATEQTTTLPFPDLYLAGSGAIYPNSVVIGGSTVLQGNLSDASWPGDPDA